MIRASGTPAALIGGTNMLWESIEEIERYNERSGFHFFKPDTMRFFHSRVYPQIYGGRYFITSERCTWGEGHPRLYTVRQALPDGRCVSMGAFQQYKTLSAARSAAAKLASADASILARGENPHPEDSPVHEYYSWITGREARQ